MSVARLARLRRRARLVLTVEAVSLAALWPACVLALFLIVCLAGFGGWRTDLVAGLALAIATRHGYRAYQRPEPRQIDRRIERDSGLSHRPIAALEDVPATGDSGMPLWDAHRARLERTLRGARVGVPAPDFAARDPFALRVLLLLALIAAWIAAGPNAADRLAASLRMPVLFPGAGIGVQAWITPPRWAGATPHLLDAGAGPTRALRGSTLSLIVTGAGAGPPAAILGGKRLAFATIDRGSYRAHRRLETSTALVIGPFWHRIAQYRIEVVTPMPPTIAFSRPPMPAADGTRVDLAWTGNSEYGLSKLDLRLAPPAMPGALTDRASLPAREGAAHAIGGKARLDLLASPYAGMKVDAVLAATNRNGQTGLSAPASFTLPAPSLRNRTARAIETLRRDLALNRAPKAALADRLAALATTPPAPVTPDTRKAIAAEAPKLAKAGQDESRLEAALWTLVQRAERGATYRTSQELAASRAALRHALDQAESGHSPSARQFRQLMARLHQAMQAQIDAEARNGARDLSSQRRQMSAIDRLAGRIARELTAGQTARAEQDMKRLQQMLSRMQAPPPSAAEQARQQATQQAGQHLSRIMREEARLMDQTSRRNSAPQLGNHAMQQPDQASRSLAQQQGALQRQLAAAAQSMQSSGLKPMPQLGQGQSAMAGARGHLQQGDLAGALPAERAAIHALQQAQNALRTMRGGQGQGGGPSGLGQQASGGRGEYGSQSHGTVRLGRAGAHSDARRIQGELIRRDGAPNLPPDAHRYYGRLLGDGY